jgi:hypothetical protein
MENSEPLYKQKSSLSLDIELINETMNSNLKYKSKKNFVSKLQDTVKENKNGFVNRLKNLIKEYKIEN